MLAYDVHHLGEEGTRALFVITPKQIGRDQKYSHAVLRGSEGPCVLNHLVQHRQRFLFQLFLGRRDALGECGNPTSRGEYEGKEIFITPHCI